jgi:hypothetical protein
MGFLSNLSDEQVAAAAELLSDEGFKKLLIYITEEVTLLSLKAVNFAGEEGERIKGACIAMQELRDSLMFSRENMKSLEDAREFDNYKGDLFSP